MVEAYEQHDERADRKLQFTTVDFSGELTVTDPLAFVAALGTGIGHDDRDQISLGLAARIAGLAYSEMIDELGRRGIATIRLQPGELERELAAFDS